MKNKTILLVLGIALVGIGFFGGTQLTRMQSMSGPEAAKTALRVTGIIEEQYKASEEANSFLVPEYLTELMHVETKSMQDIDKAISDEYKNAQKVYSEKEKLYKELALLRIEAKYDPVVQDILDKHMERLKELNKEYYKKLSDYNQAVYKWINFYESIQKEMKLKKTDGHYKRLQKSIDTWKYNRTI